MDRRTRNGLRRHPDKKGRNGLRNDANWQAVKQVRRNGEPPEAESRVKLRIGFVEVLPSRR